MKKLVFLIFLLACFIRFQFFPDNIYFGYDQARDAFESQNIYKNFDIKIVGPSTAAENLFHGPLYWYLIGPFYILGNGNPNLAAAFLLLLNAIGVFLIFWIGKTMFDSKTGILASLIFAVSFEQTQYALYFGNPAPAVLSIMLFYEGLALLIFKRNWLGFPLSLFGLGLSAQFEFFLVYLFIVLFIYAIIFKSSIITVLNAKRIIVSFLTLLVALSSYLLAEIKFDFRTTKSLASMLMRVGQDNGNLSYTIGLYFRKLSQHFNDNIFSSDASTVLFYSLIVTIFYILLKRKKENAQVLFLLVWLFSNALLLIFGLSNLYYTNIGISPAVILLTSFFVSRIFGKFFILGLSLLILIFISNFRLILNQNPNGIINGIYVQEGMLLSREKQIIDYIYNQAQGKPVVVSALTMPLKINTTWAYLFNWYGKEKYGYVPYWSGEVALGYPGSLPLWKSQEKSYIMFSIIEPTRGVRGAFIEDFISGQEQYGEVVDEKIFGNSPYAQLKVQMRESK